MSARLGFDERTAALAGAARSDSSASGLVLLGSSSSVAAHRRDEWSDHDFFVLAKPGQERSLRDVERWLPHPERLAIAAREGEIGFAAIYDDGHLFEFAAASAAELAGAVATADFEIVFDDGDVAPLIAGAQARAAAGAGADVGNAVDEVALTLVKLLVGVGRARRGERLIAGQFVHCWAVKHLVRAIRLRMPVGSSAGDPLDPVRRFERDYPELGARLERVLDEPLERAARGLFELCRDTLEPEWSEFPTRAADAVGRRLGWVADARS